MFPSFRLSAFSYAVLYPSLLIHFALLNFFSLVPHCFGFWVFLNKADIDSASAVFRHHRWCFCPFNVIDTQATQSAEGINEQPLWADIVGIMATVCSCTYECITYLILCGSVLTVRLCRCVSSSYKMSFLLSESGQPCPEPLSLPL